MGEAVENWVVEVAREVAAGSGDVEEAFTRLFADRRVTEPVLRRAQRLAAADPAVPDRVAGLLTSVLATGSFRSRATGGGGWDVPGLPAVTC